MDLYTTCTNFVPQNCQPECQTACWKMLFKSTGRSQVLNFHVSWCNISWCNSYSVLHNISSDILIHTLWCEIFFRPDNLVLPCWDKPGLEFHESQACQSPAQARPSTSLNRNSSICSVSWYSHCWVSFALGETWALEVCEDVGHWSGETNAEWQIGWLTKGRAVWNIRISLNTQ